MRSCNEEEIDQLRAQLAAVTAERDEAWRNIEEEAAFVALKAAIERAERKRCPCEFGSPCHDQCSCANPVASGGCRRCCTFGSPEQQAGMAKVLIENEQRAEKAEAVVKDYSDQIIAYRTAEKQRNELVGQEFAYLVWCPPGDEFDCRVMHTCDEAERLNEEHLDSVEEGVEPNFTPGVFPLVLASTAEARAVAHWSECEAWRAWEQADAREVDHTWLTVQQAREASDRARDNPTYMPPTREGENP